MTPISDTQDRVTSVLDAAGVPAALWTEDPESDAGVVVERPGYHISESGRRYAAVSILGRNGAPESVRQCERDGLVQAAHAALHAAGFTVTVNEYGRLHVKVS